VRAQLVVEQRRAARSRHLVDGNPGDVVGYTIGRNILDQILAQPGCVGIRFFNALNEAGQKTLVYAGVDAAGNDIVKKVVVEEDGKLATVPAIVADRVNPWEYLISIFTK